MEHSILRKHLPVVVVVATMMMFSVCFSWLAIARHNNLHSGRFDLGIMEQTIWNTVHGRWFSLTDPYGVNEIPRLTFHTDVFLVLLAPLYAIAPYTETLLILQALCLASGGLAVWLLATKILRHSWLAAVLGISYLFNLTVQGTAVNDFHAVCFATPLIIWVFWAAVSRRYWLMLILSGLAVLTKEEVGLMLPAVGIYLLLAQKQRRWGWVMITAPVAWSLLMMLVIIPSFSDNLTSPLNQQRAFRLGAAPIIQRLVMHPLDSWGLLANQHTLLYGIFLLLPLGFLSASSLLIFAVIPDFIISLVLNRFPENSLLDQYNSTIVPWLYISAIYGLTGILHKIQSRVASRNLRLLLVGFWVVIWGIFSACYFGPSVIAQSAYPSVIGQQNEYALLVRDWAQRIPSGVSVSATNNIGSHFSQRRWLYTFPIGIDRAEYVVVLENQGITVVSNRADVSIKIKALRQDPAWEKLYQRGDFTVLKRK